MLLPLMGSSSMFLALAALAVWAFDRAPRSQEARIRALAGQAHALDDAGAPFRERVIVPLVAGLGSRISSVMPATLVRHVERRLVVAGLPVTATLLWCLILTAAGIAAGMWTLLVMAVSDGAPHPTLAVLVAPVALVGAALPLAWLSTRARRRQDEMNKCMPDALDLLTICLEAGLGLDAAMQQVATNQQGPFSDEILGMLREIGLGKARDQALRDLAERTDLDDVRALASAIVQARQMGTSLTPVLRAETRRMRTRLRQRVEQQARRAPVRMVFPLVFCLMPALFIFTLGPLIVSVVEFLSGP